MTGERAREEIYLSLVEQRYTKVLFLFVSLHLRERKNNPQKQRSDVVISNKCINME